MILPYWSTISLAVLPAAAVGQQITVPGRACHPVGPPPLDVIVDRTETERELPAAMGNSLTGQILVAIASEPTGIPLQVRSLASEPIGLNAEPASDCQPTRRDQPSGPARELIATTTEPAPSERSSGVRDLDEAPIRWIKAWTFDPALVDGFPVRARATER